MSQSNCKFRFQTKLLAIVLTLFCSELIADNGYVNDLPVTWDWPFPFVLSGDESIGNGTCVIMSNNADNRTRRYRVRVRDNDSVGFELEQISPGTAGRLPVSITWTDSLLGTFDLVDGTQLGTRFTGSLSTSCNTTSTLTATISQTDYLSVPAGNYYDSFQIRVRGNGNAFSSVDIDVDVPEFVRVSFPGGDIDVPFSTTVDQLVVEQFCIYTNASNGTVGVAINLLNTDDDGSHSVLDSGPDQINYSFDLRSAGGGTTIGSVITDGGMAEVSTTIANTSSNICAVSGNSHELAVAISALDMAAAPVGFYSDTITVLVEPAL